MRSAESRLHMGGLKNDIDGQAQYVNRPAGREVTRGRTDEDAEAVGAGPLLTTVVNECARIHEAIYETFVAYPLEMRLPA